MEVWRPCLQLGPGAEPLALYPCRKRNARVLPHLLPALPPIAHAIEHAVATTFHPASSDRDRGWRGWRQIWHTMRMHSASPNANAPRPLLLPVLATAACFALVLLAGQLAAYVPAAWIGNWPAHAVALQPHTVDRFFPFDAVWYQRIADDGYLWDPNQPHLKQDVAFFPLWPMLLRLTAICLPAPMAARWMAVAMAAGFAFASVVSFTALARRLLEPSAARIAVLLFALYPGASFLLLSYPTGLMNLLTVLALLAVMDQRFFAAAMCAGLVTAIGPLGLGTALTVFTMAGLNVARQTRAAGRTWPSPRAIVWLAAIGAISVAGLLAFLVWQYIALGAPLAFIDAQDAWSLSRPWPRRIPHFLVQATILPEFVAAIGALSHAQKAHTLVALQAGLESSLNNAAHGFALIATLACVPVRCLPVLLQAVFTVALFMWFDSVSRPGHATLRLTYCAIGMFLGAAWLLRNRPRLAIAAVSASACLLAGGAFLSAAGYHVV